jgi:UDP-N-acetylenolpyruvoylglucosamine reductase
MKWKQIFNNEPFEYKIRYLNDLANATKRVKQKYCEWSYKDDIQQAERVFCYELYFQFRRIINKKRYYSKARLDGEITKTLVTTPMFGCGSDFRKDQSVFTPDLVIHFAQESRTIENQKLIIEVKTKGIGDPELTETIVKLNHYLVILNFQYAAFISVNTEFEELIAQIRHCFPNPRGTEWENNFKRILVYNYNDQKLKINRLFDLF